MPSFLWIPSTVGTIKCLIMKPVYHYNPYNNKYWQQWSPSYSPIHIQDIVTCTNVGPLFRPYYSDLGGRKIATFCMLGRTDAPSFSTPVNPDASPAISNDDCLVRSIITGEYVGFGRAKTSDTGCKLVSFSPNTCYLDGELRGLGGTSLIYTVEFQSYDWSKDWFLVLAPKPNSNATSEDDYKLEHTDMEPATLAAYIAYVEHSTIESGTGNIADASVYLFDALSHLFCTGYGNSYSEVEPSPDPDPDPDPDPSWQF